MLGYSAQLHGKASGRPHSQLNAAYIIESFLEIY